MARSSRPRRLVTAAGPSRNRTGVPCFAGRGQMPTAGHQSRWQSVPVAGVLSTNPVAVASARRVCPRRTHGCQTLRIAGASRVKPCGSRRAAPHGLRTRAARQSLRDAHMRNTAAKKRFACSSHSRHAADSPSVPRDITVPVGHPVNGSNLSPRVTDWLDRPAEGEVRGSQPRDDVVRERDGHSRVVLK
jgi:hypothetical protein